MRRPRSEGAKHWETRDERLRVIGLPDPTEGLSKVLYLAIWEKSEADLYKSLQRRYGDIGITVKLETKLLCLLVNLEERIVLICSHLETTVGCLQPPATAGPRLFDRRHPISPSDERYRPHRL